jgi:fluoride exporter
VTPRSPGAPAPASTITAATWLAVAGGGALGAVLRWVVQLAMLSQPAGFPWSTLAINVSGCLVIGVLAQWLPSRAPHPDLRTFLTVGVCGGFTTFSTFAVDTVSLASVRPGAALAYAAGTTLLCLAAVFAGFRLGDLAAGSPALSTDVPPTG